MSIKSKDEEKRNHLEQTQVSQVSTFFWVQHPYFFLLTKIIHGFLYFFFLPTLYTLKKKDVGGRQNKRDRFIVIVLKHNYLVF